MEALQAQAEDFHLVVSGALDHAAGALAAARIDQGGVTGTTDALDCFARQVRRISDAASEAEMHGLFWVGSMVESNLRALREQQRPLNATELALLREWPQLMAPYACPGKGMRVDSMIRHLGAPAWPAPLQADDAAYLRSLLAFDPVAHEGATAPETDGAPAATQLPAPGPTDLTPAMPQALPANTHGAALHAALEGLIVMLGDTDLHAGEGMALIPSVLDPYHDHLLALSKAANDAGAGQLAIACDAMAQVVQQRAALPVSMSDAECGLLNRFPMLALDCVAAPDDIGAACALMELACDRAWNCGATGVLSPAVAAADRAPVCAALADELQADTEGQHADANGAPPCPSGQQEIGADMLALFAKEFGLMQQMLADDLAAWLAPGLTNAERATALSNYVDALARVGTTADSVGLSALNGVLGLFMHRVAPLANTLGAKQYALLAALPERLADYLDCPQDETRCAPLVTLLCDPAWRKPLRQDAAAVWVMALAQVQIVADAAPVDVPVSRIACAADVSLALPQDCSVELFDGLLQELPVQVHHFTCAIERLTGGHGAMSDVEQAKRAAHTLKGAANTVGIAGIARLTHHLEEVLIGVSDRQRLPDSQLAQLLTEAGDCLEAMSEAVSESGQAPAHALTLLQRVIDYADGGAPVHEEEHGERDVAVATAAEAPARDGDVAEEAASKTASAAISETANDTANEAAPSAELGQMLRVPAPVVDELLRLAGENVISNSQIKERLRQTQKQSKAVQKQDVLFARLIAELENLVAVRGLGDAPTAAKGDGQFDPLEFERYSELHTITNQLIEASTDARQLSGQFDEQLDALGELIEVQRRLQMESQHAVIRTRLVPVSSVAARLQRAVRQACRLVDKQVTLDITGSATNIDSNMLHELLDPLMHILRNAVDHGIETPAARLASGKPATGQITLHFSREGNAIVVRCQDDGAGLDYAAIARTALQRRLIAPERIPGDEELGRLILMPGFSTRDASTEVSGRGIGMDAVHTRILEMKGNLLLHSRAGLGLTVELRLPASLLSEHTLLTRIDGKLLAISSRHIVDIDYITPDQVLLLGKEPVYRVDNKVYPLHRLEQLLGLPIDPKSAGRGSPVLLTQLDSGASCAIQVPELVDGREVVVKKLGRYVPKIMGTIGAVILGDGGVAPVLDLPELLRATRPEARLSGAGQDAGRVTPTSATSRPARSALIVDDSLSARRAAAQIMRDAGFEVRTAIDGLDAAGQLEQALPDIILVDMEMPRMNGLELTAHVRGRSATRHIPVVMITSRSTEKHRLQGDAAGVDAYLVKPFTEEALMAHVARLVKEAAWT